MIQTAIVFPDADDWTQSDFMRQVLEMLQQAVKTEKYGPFVLLCSEGWKEHLDKPYAPCPDAVNPTRTLRGRVLDLKQIVGVFQCNALEKYDVLLLECVVKAGDGYGDGGWPEIEER